MFDVLLLGSPAHTETKRSQLEGSKENPTVQVKVFIFSYSYMHFRLGYSSVSLFEHITLNLVTSYYKQLHTCSIIIIIIIQFWYGLIPLNGGGQIHPTLTANSPTPTFYLARFKASSFSKPTLLLSFSTFVFHVFFGRPHFLLPFTSNSNAFLKTCPSSLLNTCPYHLTPFALFEQETFISGFTRNTVEYELLVIQICNFFLRFIWWNWCCGSTFSLVQICFKPVNIFQSSEHFSKQWTFFKPVNIFQTNEH